MGKCVCCGSEDARIEKRFVVVESLARRGDAPAERKERIHGIIDGAICRDCFAAELEQLAKQEVGNVSQYIIAGVLAVVSLALIVAGLFIPNFIAFIFVGIVLLVLVLIAFLPKMLSERKRVAAMRSGAMDEQIPEFAGRVIARCLERNGGKKGFYGFTPEFQPLNGENHSVCIIELAPGMNSVKPSALVRRYGISQKTEDDIKKLALSR